MSELPVILDPLNNRGTAFTDAERRRLGLHGLLPPVVQTIEEQLTRTYDSRQWILMPIRGQSAG